MPADNGPRVIHVVRDEGLPRVDADTALTHSAYWAAVNTIADDLAAIPWGVYRRRPGGGREAADDHALSWLLSVAPNDEQSAFLFRQTWVKNALTWGAGVVEVDRDAAGRPAALWNVEPWRVRPARDAGGRLYYRVRNHTGPDTALYPDEVMVLVGMPDDSGAWGLSVIEFAARAIGLALVADRHAARGFANDGRPGGAIERQKKMTQEARDRYRADWKRIHGGNPNEVAILEEGDKFAPFEPTSPQDAQLLASRQFSATDIARFFKIPAHKIGDLTRSTNNNIEQQALEYVQGTLQPWAVRMEQTANALFGRKQAGNYYTKMNFGSLMRGDSAARSQYLTRMVTAGLMCPDDARELEDLNPIPGGLGKTFFVPVNVQPIDRAVNPPQPPAIAPPKSEPPDPDPLPTDEPKDAPDPSAALRPVFRDAAARVLRAEGHEAAAALKRLAAVNPPDGRPAALAKWRDGFLTKHRGYVAKTFDPAAAALAGAGSAAAGVVLDVESGHECGAFLERLAALTGEPDGSTLAAEWETGADALAERVMHRVAVAAKVYGV